MDLATSSISFSTPTVVFPAKVVPSNASTFALCLKNALNLFDKLTRMIETEPINQVETEFIKKASCGALIFGKVYEGEAYKFDVKSFYPSMMNSNQKYPVKDGEYKNITTDEINNIEYPSYGIYRCIITKSETVNDKLFRFNKNSYYTHMDLKRAKELGFNIEMMSAEYYKSFPSIGQREIKDKKFYVYGNILYSKPLYKNEPTHTSFFNFDTVYLSHYLTTEPSNIESTLVELFKFGKNRLFERISPKKSWEGSIGGLVFSMIAAYILSLFFTELSCLEWIGMAIIIVILGTLGDLVESMFKRSLNIKDSGNILPGHGGILDRLDALFISAPFVFFYLIIISF